MLKEERQQIILDMLVKEGKLVAAELSSRLNVSEDTVRRDLREMDNAGLLHRVHGGALPSSPTLASFGDRERLGAEAKLSLAQGATSLIRSGQVILMDGSTTTLQIAKTIPAHISATVITNSPPVAVALASHPGIEVTMLGGKLFKDSLVNLGPAAIQELQHIRADLCFLGVYCIHPEFGISLPHNDEAFVKRAMIAGSSEVVALVTPDKLGTSAPFIVAQASALTCMITSNEVPEDILLPYREQGITVIQY
ncbi:DeoR family transcriptional regulator [Bacillus sp. FJAT-27264]|uniref:DeoR/GlpR family DNA-binding transcription regulator n=1 Tax=Paenibacillus sp. (strain DSM 101736 / FJAT-27264) TaxID=1850362 RepID=UPI000807B237|nr:DeoR/GlpR family DNA-binding transcription regulator [Bacillus sp. FJAT-27264]OBZ09698.1 DeoR family transcriptional regulator [Bacillus sp. FJAT-27264]